MNHSPMTRSRVKKPIVERIICSARFDDGILKFSFFGGGEDIFNLKIVREDYFFFKINFL